MYTTIGWESGFEKAHCFTLRETEAGTFSIHRMCRYCVHLSELMETDRVVPVAILLRPGQYQDSLVLVGDRHTYLHFEIIACDLKGIPVDKYMDSDNIVARVNLPNMAYRREGRLEGTILTLRRLLAIKFKTVPEWADELLKNAAQSDLEQWTDRILAASTIEEVFGKRR